MQTYWLLGHEKLQINVNEMSSSIEEVFESVFEPEFLQIIWGHDFDESYGELFSL